LKKIEKQLDLPIPLTMYADRHSWTNITKSRDVPISVISEDIGHDSENTTQIYLASLDTTVVDKTNKKILDLL
jgi:integrase